MICSICASSISSEAIYRLIPRVPTTTMQKIANASATRRRSPRLSPGTRNQTIAESVNCLNGVVTSGPAQCAPQFVHMAAQRIARALRISPYFRFKLPAAEYTPRLAHHESKQANAFRRQLDALACELYGQRRWIERQIAGFQRTAGDFPPVALVHRDQASFNFFQGKGLEQIIIRATVETLQLVFQGIARSKHENRRIKVRFLTKLST